MFASSWDTEARNQQHRMNAEMEGDNTKPEHKWSWRIVLLTAICSVAWATATMGFDRFSPKHARLNAICLVSYWVFLVPIWFLAEWKIWGKDSAVRGPRRFVRDVWMGAAALVILLSLRDLMPNPPATPSFTIQVQPELLKTTIWPFVTVFGFVLFRESIGNFFSGISSRVSKLTAFGTTVELATLPTAKALSAPRLDELRPGVAAVAGDSSSSLLRSLADAGHADYVVVNLGDGREWISSRLFILAALIPRVRPIKRIVYLKGPDSQFLGISTPEALYRALAERYEWLEAAYITSHVAISKANAGPLFLNENGMWLYFNLSMQPGRSLLGSIGKDDAQWVLNSFLDQVKATADPGMSDWVRIDSNYVYWEHAEWIASDVLLGLLGSNLDPKSVKRDPSQDDSVAARTLLRHEEAYVPIVDTANRFLRLVDRRSAIDEMVARWLSAPT